MLNNQTYQNGKEEASGINNPSLNPSSEIKKNHMIASFGLNNVLDTTATQSYNQSNFQGINSHQNKNKICDNKEEYLFTKEIPTILTKPEKTLATSYFSPFDSFSSLPLDKKNEEHSQMHKANFSQLNYPYSQSNFPQPIQTNQDQELMNGHANLENKPINQVVIQGKFTPITYLNYLPSQSPVNHLTGLKIRNDISGGGMQMKSAQSNRSSSGHKGIPNCMQEQNVNEGNRLPVLDAKMAENLIEKNQILLSQISEAQKELDLKDNIIKNTYKIVFLDNKDSNWNVMKIMEDYVLLCGENEKLSFGFVQKLQTIDQLSQQINELNIQKENWKTLYDNKNNEILAFESHQTAIRDEQQRLLVENSELREHFLNSNKIISENKNIKVEFETLKTQSTVKIKDLENKLNQILDENASLNKILSERVDEVQYLQTTIKQMQDTYSEQFSSDTHFQKIIKDLEAEIQRMDHRMEEIMEEKENEMNIRLQGEEENNSLRMQLQMKRLELEQLRLGSVSNAGMEVQVRKKQEQIEDLLLKLERLQRNLTQSQEDKESYTYDLKVVQEQLLKMERKYEERQSENLQLLQRQSELQSQLKQLSLSKETDLMEKDMKQLFFEKKQIDIALKDAQQEKERLKTQLSQSRKECDNITTHLIMEKQKLADTERYYSQELERVQQDTQKEHEIYKLNAKIEVIEENMQSLKLQLSQSQDKLNEKTLDLEEANLHIKELKIKLERVTLIEHTLHTLDNENTLLAQQKQNTLSQVQILQERILVLYIENERLHKVVGQLNETLESQKERMKKEEMFFQIEVEKIESEIKEERIQFQDVIRNLELQLQQSDVQRDKETGQDKNQLQILQNDYMNLKHEFQLAIDTLKARDQHINNLENNYNQAIQGDRSAFIIQKLEEKLQILAAENYRLNKILVDRARSSNYSFNAW